MNVALRLDPRGHAAGINACGVEHTDASSSNAGKALLEQVDALGADLLVMGCYGRSRLSQRIFGGATRHVLKNMNVPALLSH